MGIAEHKLSKQHVGKWKKIFIDAGKKMCCSPSDFTKKVPQVGVAIVGGKKVRLVEAQIKTKNFKKCFG